MKTDLESIKQRCYVRHVVRENPTLYKRRGFYQKYEKQHNYDKLLKLQELINLEMSSFKAWCTLNDVDQRYSNYLRYLETTSPVKEALL